MPGGRLPLVVGTHNLHDLAGTPTPFADVIGFTEAIPARVEAMAWSHGYASSVCEDQKDLVLVWRPHRFTASSERYYPVHPGAAKITPHRGLYEVLGALDGHPAVLMLEHRINAAFPPYRRGEGVLRRVLWRWHAARTARRIRHHKRRGRLVVAMGDLNTPAGKAGYGGLLHEAGAGYDRIGSTRPVSGTLALSREGSDHRRLVTSIL